jgi:hypothetical protein
VPQRQKPAVPPWSRLEHPRTSELKKARFQLKPTVLLLPAFAPVPTAAAVPPDLAESARQIERFAATRGQESESVRLKHFFDLYWTTRMRAVHDHLLGHGQLPLDLLETSVKAWVAEAKVAGAKVPGKP